MSRRETPKPGQMSAIAAAAASSGAMPPPGAAAGQVPLTPGSGLVSRGEQHGQAPEHPPAEAPPVAPPARPAVRPGRRRGGQRHAPAVVTAVALTVRVDPDEATAIDQFVLELRGEARRTRLDKAEVLRELLTLAREDATIQRKLVKRLT